MLGFCVRPNALCLLRSPRIKLSSSAFTGLSGGISGRARAPRFTSAAACGLNPPNSAALIGFPGLAARAPTYFVKSPRQGLCLLHLKIEAQFASVGFLSLEEFVARLVPTGSVAALNETASRQVYARLADISAVSNAI